MAYDEGLAQRIRERLEEREDYGEKKMFCGLCFLRGGNMCAGVVGDELMLRVGPDAYDECLAKPHAREMDFTGRAMKGMVYVGTDGIESDDALAAWLDRGVAFSGALPPKRRCAPGRPDAATCADRAASRGRARR